MPERFSVTWPRADIHHKRWYGVSGCLRAKQASAKPANVHLILADPWSKEWGQPQPAILTANALGNIHCARKEEETRLNLGDHVFRVTCPLLAGFPINPGVLGLSRRIRHDFCLGNDEACAGFCERLSLLYTMLGRACISSCALRLCMIESVLFYEI